MLLYCTLLLLSFVEERHAPLVSGVGRLLRSSAAKLQALSNLNRTIQGLLECTRTEENKNKCQQKLLVGMFHAYRGPVLDALTGDTCCNFECMRGIIQQAFYGVLTDLRQQGALSNDARKVLETVDDYMENLIVAIGWQVVANDRTLLSELDQLLE